MGYDERQHEAIGERGGTGRTRVDAWRLRVGQPTRITSCFCSWRPQRAVAVSRCRMDSRGPCNAGLLAGRNRSGHRLRKTAGIDIRHDHPTWSGRRGVWRYFKEVESLFGEKELHE